MVVLFFIRYPWLWTPASAPTVRRSGAGTWVWQPAVTTGSSPEAAGASGPSLMNDVTLACHLSSWGPGFPMSKLGEDLRGLGGTAS